MSESNCIPFAASYRIQNRTINDRRTRIEQCPLFPDIVILLIILSSELHPNFLEHVTNFSFWKCYIERITPKLRMIRRMIKRMKSTVFAQESVSSAVSPVRK